MKHMIKYGMVLTLVMPALVGFGWDDCYRVPELCSQLTKLYSQLPEISTLKSAGAGLCGAAIGYYGFARPQNGLLRTALGAGLGYGAHKLYKSYYGELSEFRDETAKNFKDVDDKLDKVYENVTTVRTLCTEAAAYMKIQFPLLFDQLKAANDKFVKVDTQLIDLCNKVASVYQFLLKYDELNKTRYAKLRSDNKKTHENQARMLQNQERMLLFLWQLSNKSLSTRWSAGQ